MARGETQPCPEGQFKGREGRDCCRSNGGCKGYVLKDVPKALTSPMKLVGQSWHVDTGWVGWTHSVIGASGYLVEAIVGSIGVEWRECL